MNDQILINKLASCNSEFQGGPTQIKICKMMLETLGIWQLKIMTYYIYFGV